jgi:hypothetical protein
MRRFTTLSASGLYFDELVGIGKHAVVTSLGTLLTHAFRALEKPRKASISTEGIQTEMEFKYTSLPLK